MSLLNSYKKTNNKPNKKTTSITATLLLAALTLSTTGCNTTQELKPTASVMVGAHKSL